MKNNNPWRNVPTNFLFYGTLREGNGNYQRLVAPPLSKGGAEFEGTHILSGYKMYDVGYKAFPFIVKTGKEEDKITVEAYTISDASYAERIHGMELGAGYDVEEVTINNKTYSIYVYERPRARENQVEGGDWTTYYRSPEKVTKVTI